jgi:hypothetical protein
MAALAVTATGGRSCIPEKPSVVPSCFIVSVVLALRDCVWRWSHIPENQPVVLACRDCVWRWSDIPEERTVVPSLVVVASS